jgi:hypothetical protein
MENLHLIFLINEQARFEVAVIPDERSAQALYVTLRRDSSRSAWPHVRHQHQRPRLLTNPTGGIRRPQRRPLVAERYGWSSWWARRAGERGRVRICDRSGVRQRFHVDHGLYQRQQ